LLYYEGLSQDDAAKLLGVTTRTIKRRWQSAKLKLFKGLQSESEG
jgi:DNA-directed RNA polymerase specialized sigma24 family protein